MLTETKTLVCSPDVLEVELEVSLKLFLGRPPTVEDFQKVTCIINEQEELPRPYRFYYNSDLFCVVSATSINGDFQWHVQNVQKVEVAKKTAAIGISTHVGNFNGVIKVTDTTT